jgi:hypothetical protein
MNYSDMKTEQMFADIEHREKARAEAMPTEKDALFQMFEAYKRLKELGWYDIMYCPKDGQMFDAISAGSTGTAPTKYEEGKHRGRFWAYEANDVWPSSPILFKLQEQKDG